MSTVEIQLVGKQVLVLLPFPKNTYEAIWITEIQIQNKQENKEEVKINFARRDMSHISLTNLIFHPRVHNQFTWKQSIGTNLVSCPLDAPLTCRNQNRSPASSRWFDNLSRSPSGESRTGSCGRRASRLPGRWRQSARDSPSYIIFITQHHVKWLLRYKVMLGLRKNFARKCAGKLILSFSHLFGLIQINRK